MRRLIMPWKSMFTFVFMIGGLFLLESFVGLIVASNSITFKGTECSVTKMEPSNDFIVTELSCKEGDARSRNGKFAIEHLKSPKSPITCTVYGGIGDAECEVAK